jgi:hypothetical protein
MFKEISDFHPSFYLKTISHPDNHQHRASIRLHFTDTSLIQQTFPLHRDVYLHSQNKHHPSMAENLRGGWVGESS